VGCGIGVETVGVCVSGWYEKTVNNYGVKTVGGQLQVEL
jgi:hypothetical protein